jgi:hypothetical protein
MQVLVGEIALDDQHAVHHARAKVQVDPTERVVAFAE